VDSASPISDRPPSAFSSGGETAIVGDLHGCGEAFVSLLEALDQIAPAGRVVLVGDLLTKGPSPGLVAAAIDHRRLEGRPVESVAGNHDWRLLESMRAWGSGGSAQGTMLERSIPSVDRRCIEHLAAAGLLATAERILDRASARAMIRGEGWAVVHAGIDPHLGLEATPDELKRSLKPRPGEEPWWDRYYGEDGLVVCGHRPLDEPLRRSIGGQPVAIACDTGCVLGGGLTAYLVQEDRFVSVPSGGGAVSVRRPARVASSPRAASVAPSRSSVA
jgi:hypothetical protein